MSYARIGVDGSDVFVCHNDRNGFVCLHHRGKSFTSHRAEDMIRHLEEHKLEGDVVPESCFKKLLEKTGSEF